MTRYGPLIAPLVTPLDEEGAVCRSSVARQVGSLRGKVDALMPALSTGEGWLLDDRQWTDMVGHTCRYADGVPVIAGAEVPTTADVIARGRTAAELGAVGLAVTSPFGADVGQDAVERHYRQVSAALDIDLFVYNESAVSGNTTRLETLVRVCRLPRVVGVKESSGTAELPRQLKAAATGVPVYAGWENLLWACAPNDGFIGPLALLEPELCREMLTHPTPALQQKIDEAADRYGIFDTEWYRTVKRELRRRGVVTHDSAVADHTVHADSPALREGTG